jgi:high affinity Mn2+ porin
MRLGSKGNLQTTGATAALACAATALTAADVSTNSVADPVAPMPNKTQPAAENPAESQPENWNWHVQNTDIVQGYPAFSAKYTNPGFNSLPAGGETRETVSADLMAGVRLWTGAEAHVDGLMWQGYGLGHTLGIEAFPNGEAYRVGTTVPNVNLARAFIRQTINLGGDEETIDDDQLHLAGTQDVSHLTLTLGKISLIDIFDNNTYANDPRTQFMNWAFVANEAWDYPADSLGYTTGLAAELYEPRWTLRYGFFQVPRSSNGLAQDQRYLAAWGMVTELERRYSILNHPGVIRFLAYLNRAHMGSYQDAINNFNSGGSIDITQTRANRFKYGFGLNWEQEITENIGVFSRLGWSDGHTEAWAYTDVDRSASLGVSVKGGSWRRPDDTFGLAGVISGITPVHQQFFADGGTGILGGDGTLNYSWEKALETYYDFKIWKTIHAALDYQFVADPAFNADRGPISIFTARLHWEF